jgi:hypothetical protein
MVDAILACGQQGGCRCIKEVQGLFQDTAPDNRERPDLSISGLMAVNVVLDVKITEYDTSNLTMAQAKRPQRAVLRGEREKDIKYAEEVAAEGKVFIPASFSTSGAFGPKFKVFFGDLIKQSSEYNNIPPAALTIYWLRRFSVTLHNAVASSFFKHLSRANARAFRDESRELGVVVEQSYSGPASVSNRRGLD